MTTDEIKGLIKKRAHAGKDYLEIKRELGRFNLSDEEERKLLMKADEYIIEYQLAEQAIDELVEKPYKKKGRIFDRF